MIGSSSSQLALCTALWWASCHLGQHDRNNKAMCFSSSIRVTWACLNGGRRVPKEQGEALAQKSHFTTFCWPKSVSMPAQRKGKWTQSPSLDGEELSSCTEKGVSTEGNYYDYFGKWKLFSPILNFTKTQHGDETYASWYERVIGTGLALLSSTTRKLGKVNKNKFSAIGKRTLQNYDSQEKGTNEMISKISLALPSSLKINFLKILRKNPHKNSA